MKAATFVLTVPPQPPLVVQIPGVLRVAHELAAACPASRIVFCTPRPGWLEPWRACLAELPWAEAPDDDRARPLSDVLDAEAPAVVLGPDGAPDTASLHTFVAESAMCAEPSAWVWNGAVVAVLYPRASQLRGASAREALAAPGARRLPVPPGAWESLVTPEGIRRAEARLFRSLRKETDGYLARLDRMLSITLSRLLIRTPVTPNAITLASLAVGLVGAAWLASARYGTTLLGAALLWLTCVLDGCDGEVARLTLRASRLGARFDVIADNIVHLAVFVAIPVHVARTRAELDVWRPAAALLVGVLLCMVSVWWLILRRPTASRGAQLVYERLASRDFVYVVLFLAAIGHLDWFLWAGAIGTYLFALSLWLIARPAPR